MFSFLEEYKLREDLFEGKGIEKVMKYPHHFYAPYPEDLPKALETFDPFPYELKVFYEQIGFGFMHRRKGKINRLLDPVSLVLVNLRRDEYRYDKFLEKTLGYYDINRQLLFFQLDSGEYLAIDRTETNGCNRISYRDEKLSNSLLELLTNYHKDKYHLLDYIEYIERKKRKEEIRQSKSHNTLNNRSEDAPSLSNDEKPEIIKPQVQPPPQNPNKNRWTTLFDDDETVIGRKT